MRLILAALLALLWWPLFALAQPDTLRQRDWRLYWTNEFSTPGDSSTVAAHWRFDYPWGRSISPLEGQYYVGQQIKADSGYLHLQARQLPAPVLKEARLSRFNYLSGMLFSLPGQDSMQCASCPPTARGFLYGLFEIRCRLPRSPHSFAAFWLYGNPDEVDVFEASQPQSITNNVILKNHDYWRTGPVAQPNEACQCAYYWPGPTPLAAQYHKYALQWLPDALVYYVDGSPIRRETRLLPLGCPLNLIANLAMFRWSSVRADSLSIDYIRVYKPRQPVVPPLARYGPPRAGFFSWPRTTAAALNDQRPVERWRLEALPQHRPRLVLASSENPRCGSTHALPVAGRWLTPLVSYADGDTPLHLVLSPDNGAAQALSWTLYDPLGQPVRSGQQLPAVAWALAWPNLPPGAYQLRLRCGGLQVRQAVFNLGQPADSAPTPAWLAQP